MSLLKLLEMFSNPQLTPYEVSQLRSHLHESPTSLFEPLWDIDSSGVERAPSEVERLRARVVELELVVKVLGDLLVERGLLEGGALAGRVEALRARIVEDAATAREAQRARHAEEKRAAEEARRLRSVTCSACGAVVPEGDSYLSSDGPLCGGCHLAREP